MKLGLAALRITVGGLFVGHGLQKLAGWFGGHGLEGTAQFMESIGMRPGRRHATASGVAEAAGGALLAAGLLTPVGATLISATMITAIRKVHAPNGVWVTDGGFEYNLALLATVFAITDVGPGAWSLDRALGLERSGPLWALAELGAAVAGSTAAIMSGAQGAGAEAAATAAPGTVGDPASPNGDAA